MTGNEFIRKARALGKRRGVAVVLDATRSKEAIKPSISARHLPWFEIQKTN